MSTYTLYLPKTIAALIFTTAASFCTAMEERSNNGLNVPVVARISYFCPQMTVPHKDISFLSVQFPNGERIETKGSTWSNNGGRHTFSYNGQEIDTISLYPEAFAPTSPPYVLTVNIMTGYIDEGRLESWDPIYLTLNKDLITPNLEAIRINHTSKSITDMKIQYNHAK